MRRKSSSIWRLVRAVGAGAHHRRGDFREARRVRSDVGVAAAEIKFAGEFGNGVRFDQHDFEAVGELAVRARAARRPGAREPSAGTFAGGCGS